MTFWRAHCVPPIVRKLTLQFIPIRLDYSGTRPDPRLACGTTRGPTPVRGDWPLHPMTGYAIEGNVKVYIPEWDDQQVQIKMEQSAWFDGSMVRYLAGRQTSWHVVR